MGAAEPDSVDLEAINGTEHLWDWLTLGMMINTHHRPVLIGPMPLLRLFMHHSDPGSSPLVLRTCNFMRKCLAVCFWGMAYDDKIQFQQVLNTMIDTITCTTI